MDNYNTSKRHDGHEESVDVFDLAGMDHTTTTFMPLIPFPTHAYGGMTVEEAFSVHPLLMRYALIES